MSMDAIRGDVLTKERVKKRDVIIIEGKTGGVEYRATQIPIDFYLKRKNINQKEYNAANKLFRDFTLSGQTSGMTANLNPTRSGGGAFTTAQLEARERWRNAVDAIYGLVARQMVIDVVCYGYWLKDGNYIGYKTGQMAMPRFKEAINDLIKHYDA